MIQNEYDTLPPILQKVLDHGFVIFQDGDYDLNIVGVRNLNSAKDNQFDDKLIVAYRKGSIWITEEFVISMSKRIKEKKEDILKAMKKKESGRF